MGAPKRLVKPSTENIQQVDQLKAELNPSVHYDYTEQIKDIMREHKDHCAQLNRPVPMRQYMWDLFAVSVIMQLTDKWCTSGKDYPNDKYTSMSPEELITMARDELDNILTGKRDYKLVSEEQEDISTYPYTTTQKLLNIMRSAYIASIAFVKLREYEELFVLPSASDVNTSEGE